MPESADHGIGEPWLIVREDLRIRRLTALQLVNHHGRARRRNLRGRFRPRRPAGCAAGWPSSPSGRSGAGQQLLEFRPAERIERVDRDEAAALGADKEIVVVAEARVHDRLGLGALGVGAALRIVAVLNGELFERGAAVEGHACRCGGRSRTRGCRRKGRLRWRWRCWSVPRSPGTQATASGSRGTSAQRLGQRDHPVVGARQRP